MNEQVKAIRAEIKRLEEIHERNLKKPMERGRIGFAHGVVECCDRILSFIDSLPEETDNEEPNRPKLSDNLDEVAQKVEDYYDVGEERGYLCCHRGDIKDAFIAGAKWDREQMLKEAVEGKIYGCDGLHWIETDIDENIKGKEGDKARIIIVKEDEQ